MAYDLEDHLLQTPNGSKPRQSLRVRVCGSFAALVLMVPLKEERFATDWEARKGRGPVPLMDHSVPTCDHCRVLVLRNTLIPEKAGVRVSIGGLCSASRACLR